SIEAFGRDVRAREGRIHGLVNNAAIATNVGGKTFDEIDLDLWDRVMRVNVRGTWLVTRALAPLFADGGHGRIVNVASDTALWGAPRLLAYVASKGGRHLDDPLARARARPARHRRNGRGARHHALRGDRIRAGRAPSLVRRRPRRVGPAAAGRHRRHRRVSAHPGRARAHRTGTSRQRRVPIHMTALVQRSLPGISYLARA